MLAVLYLISHLDRANIGNAKIEGLAADLNLVGNQWNIVLSLFFIPYVLLEVPSNILLKKFKRPSVYLGILVTAWGIIMTLHGVVKNFAGLLAVRILLGVFEAGFYPGAVYLCTFWYMPRQLASRIAWFYCTSALSGAFSGLLAAGIAQMDGVGGYEGWRWIFILEGIVTVVLGVSCFFFLIDSPTLSGRWLEPSEIRFLEIQHFIKQGGKASEDEDDKFSWYEMKMVLKNWRLYMQAYILLCISACSYGTKFTLPSIVKGMGFQNTQAQLMTVPAYVAGALSAVFFARLSDRFYWRMPFVAIPLALIAIGYSVIMSFGGDLTGSHVGPGYFALVLTTMGIYPVQPAGSSWAANNLAPAKRRAIGVAFNICIGNIGGVIGSYMYLDSENPTYWTGYGLSLAFGASGLIVALLLELSYKAGNAKKDKMSEDEVRRQHSELELFKLGDRSPLFKYTL
jgi:MFS family permease